MTQFKKKILAVLLINGMIFSAFPFLGFVQAEELAAAKNDVIVFGGTAAYGLGGSPVSLLVYRGTDYMPGQSEEIVYFDQTVTDGDGEFRFEVASKALPDIYIAQVRVKGEAEARIYHSGEPPLLQDNFEDYTGGKRNAWYSFSNPVSKYTKAELDEEHGTSLAMQGLSGNPAFAVYSFGSILPREEIYRVKFSLRSEDNAPLFYIRLLDEEWTAINKANDPYMYESFYAGGGYIGYYNGSQNWRKNTLTEWETNRWYDIEIWLDAAGEHIYYTVDGTLLGSTDFVFERDWQGVALVQEGTTNTIYLDDIQVERADWASRKRWIENGETVPPELSHYVEASVESCNVGNIFFDEESPVLTLNLKNLELEEHSEDYCIVVRDVEGNEVWTKTEMVALSPLSEEKVVLQPELPDYGTYTLEVYSGVTRVCGARLCRSVRSGVLNDSVGVCAHFDRAGGEVTACMELAEAAGFGYIRTDWTRPETSPGVFSDYFETDPRFSVYIRESGQRDIGMLALIGVNHSLYKDEDGGLYTSDEALEALTNYCCWIAEKFKGQVEYFEVGNEVNSKKNLDGSDVPCADYVKLLKAAYQGIKAGNPDAKVVAFATTTIAYKNTRKYLRDALDIMRAEGTYWFDAISIHPYHVAQPPEVSDRWMEWETWLKQGIYLQEIIEEYGLENKERWATEMGYYIVPRSSITQEKSAAYTARALALNEAYGFYDKIFFYDLQNDGTDPSYNEHNFGILECWKGVESPFAAKAAYPVIAFWNNLMTGAEAKSITESDSVYQVSFLKENRKIDVIWDVEDRKQDLDYAAQGKAMVYDMYGNLILQSDGEENIPLSPGSAPVYVVTAVGEELRVTCEEQPVRSCADLNIGARLRLECRLVSGKQGAFLAVQYCKGVPVRCERMEININGEAKMEWIYDGSYDEIKLMAWDGTETMHPLTEAKRI